MNEIEISVLLIRLDDPDMCCGYSCNFETKEEAIAGVMKFVDKMVKDGWLPISVTVDGRPIFISGVVETPPYSVN